MARISLDAGADMVYMGPRGWSRRTRSFEVDDDAIFRVVEYARGLGRTVKLAFNCLPSPGELPLGLAAIGRYVEMGVRDFIMTDPGFARRVKELYPRTRLTASVGCSVMNLREFRYYRDVGFDVIVAPCEMPPAELEEIRRHFDGQIEVLIHANLDYTYLGRCTMSSYFRCSHVEEEPGKDNFLGSPNRGGLCYRVCKSCWSVGQGSTVRLGKELGNTFFMSVDEIPRYVAMGIDCLKIQGREYSPGLVGEIVRFYRDYVDACALDLRAAEDPAWKVRAGELSAMRDAQRDRRTKALLDECSGRGEAIFAVPGKGEPSYPAPV